MLAAIARLVVRRPLIVLLLALGFVVIGAVFEDEPVVQLPT